MPISREEADGLLMCDLRSSTKAARAFLSSSVCELLILHLSAVASAYLTIRHGSAVERAGAARRGRDPLKSGGFVSASHSRTRFTPCKAGFVVPHLSGLSR